MLKKKYAGKFGKAFTIFCLVSLLAACGQKDEIQSTNLKISKEGNIISTIVEDFDKTYYTTEGLESMIQDEINSYNAKKTDAVSLQSVEIPENMEGKVIVTMSFASSEDYTEFNEEELFYGTISQAIAAGYKLPSKLISVSDQTKTIGRQDIEAMTDHHVLIMAEKTVVVLPHKAVYISEGVELIGSKKINVANANGLTYVIME